MVTLKLANTRRGGKLGDATKETLTTFGSISGGWYSDGSNFIISTYSWFHRGGNYSSGDYFSGVFVFEYDTGSGSRRNSSRAVLS